MPAYAITGARVAGIAAAVPAKQSPVEAVAGTAVDLDKVIANTGVKARHVAPPGMCTSDLCADSETRLLERLGWARESVDLLIFVSQTPDYVLPATACALHGRL